MRELSLNREVIKSHGTNIISNIRYPALHRTSARMHSPEWCEHLAQAASKSTEAFYQREQQQWCAIGLDHLTHENDDQVRDWMQDFIAHYLLAFYVKYYLKEWAAEGAEDIIQGKAVHPHDYAESLVARFVEGWEELMADAS
jgi:hypothetical protein